MTTPTNPDPEPLTDAEFRALMAIIEEKAIAAAAAADAEREAAA